MPSKTKIKKCRNAMRNAKMGKARKKLSRKPGTNKLLPLHD